MPRVTPRSPERPLAMIECTRHRWHLYFIPTASCFFTGSPPRLAPPIPNSNPPAKKIRMERGAQARAERRGYSRGVGRNEYVKSPHTPSVRKNLKPPRTRSVRSQSSVGLLRKYVRTFSNKHSKLRYPSEFLEPRGALRAPYGELARRAKDFFGVAKSARARRLGFLFSEQSK